MIGYAIGIAYVYFDVYNNVWKPLIAYIALEKAKRAARQMPAAESTNMAEPPRMV